jgi:hypothetical protein
VALNSRTSDIKCDSSKHLVISNSLPHMQSSSPPHQVSSAAFQIVPVYLL